MDGETVFFLFGFDGDAGVAVEPQSSGTLVVDFGINGAAITSFAASFFGELESEDDLVVASSCDAEADIRLEQVKEPASTFEERESFAFFDDPTFGAALVWLWPGVTGLVPSCVGWRICCVAWGGERASSVWGRELWCAGGVGDGPLDAREGRALTE